MTAANRSALAAMLSFANRAFTVREETIDDALGAVQLARTFREIDPRRIVVAGHSLGGMLRALTPADSADAAPLLGAPAA